MPRYFNLAEARAALPAVARGIREAVQSKARYVETERALRGLSQRILMNGGTAVDTAVVERWKNQNESSETSLRTALEELEELGVLVKDLDTGLVDFPTLFKGKEVYLCWRMDEGDIGHWHGTDEGFAGRKPIDRYFIEHHQGGASV